MTNSQNDRMQQADPANPASGSRPWWPFALTGVLIVAIGLAGATVFMRPVQSATAPGGPLQVDATEFKYAPNAVKAGASDVPYTGVVVFTLVNKGSVEHDIVIDGVEGKAYAKPKETVQAAFKIAKPGAYTFYCSVPGHRDAGMQGTLTVGDAPVSPAASNTGSQPAVVQAQLKPPVAGAKPLPQPQVAPPVGMRDAMLVKQTIEVKEVVGLMADGVTYKYWAFGGTVPGPMVRVRQGDTVELTLKNSAEAELTHSIDLHAVTGPGGGARATQIVPGAEATFRFQALNPGVYVYHCATPMVAHHIANGMYGLIVVEPPGGLPAVDREYYLMQGDFYIKGERGQSAHMDSAVDKMLHEDADYVLFNGSVGAVTGANSLKAKVGETVRFFFGVGGPNLTSSFHVIGEIFDRIYPEGGSNVQTNVQTTLVPTGGAVIVEFKVEVPGQYVIVDHSLARLEKGGAAILDVEGAANSSVFEVLPAGGR